MKYSDLLKIGVVFIIVLNAGCSNPESEVPFNRPNIVYILADDLGYGDVKCLNPESKIPTPNLDKMAKQGMTFTDAHSSSSLCSPTRYGILTGRYSWRTGRPGGALWSFDPPFIEHDRLTLPQYLKNNGYQTACFGKWHLGINYRDKHGKILKNTGSEKGWNIDFSRPFENGPVTRGFDYFFGMDAPNYPPYCYMENDRTIGIPSINKPDSIYGIPGIMMEEWNLYEVLPEIEKRVVKYINKQAESKQPFFLYLPLTAPHTPIAPTDEHLSKSEAGLYGDFVHQMDEVVGKVLEALKQNNMTENTLIIFTSDNGSPHLDGSNMEGESGSVLKYGHNPSYIFSGKKADIWEGGHRVPFFAQWAGKIKAGSESNEIICLTDIFATCVAILGDKLPDNAGEDSYNILPVLTGKKIIEPLREATVHLGGDGSFAIRQGKWKLELCPGSGGGGSLSPEVALQKHMPLIQLYNLENDIGEQQNVYDKYPDVVYHLTNLLEKYVKDGRSTPGNHQKNTGEPDIWRSLKVRDIKYDTNHINHLAIGKKLMMSNEESIKFSRNGLCVLTDGIRASSLFSDGYWTGVEGEDLEVLLDLGKETEITKISAGFLESQGHWIFLPLQVEFSLSNDGQEFHAAKTVAGQDLLPNENRVINDFTISYETEICRYIRLKAKSIKTCPEWHKGAGGKTWLFIDEIIVED